MLEACLSPGVADAERAEITKVVTVRVENVSFVLFAAREYLVCTASLRIARRQPAERMCQWVFVRYVIERQV